MKLRKYFSQVFAGLFVLSFSSAANADETWDCKVSGYKGSNAELEYAGANPRCPDIQIPWACYCKVEETCVESNSGRTQIFNRQEFMFCGTLAQCNMAWTTTYCR